MKVDRIYCRYYNAYINKYIVLARVRRGTEYVWRRISFDTEEEANNLKEGDFVYE